MTYLGDYVEDDTVYFLWSTNDADGASITRATDGTVSVYKDNGTTQSTAGITDTEDFDSLTGVHACTIDLSADAFYATGSDYAVVLSAATIDGQTVNAVLAHFSIENRTSQASYVLGALTDDDTQIDASALNTASGAVGSDGTGLTEAGGTGDQLTAVPWNSAWAAEVLSAVTDDDTEIDASALNSLSAMSSTVEGSITLVQALRIILAFAAGQATGAGTSAPAFRDQADTKDRIAMTTDALGNRTAVTVDGT